MAEKTHHAMIRLRSTTDGAWFVHPDLRPRLVADATTQGSNLTELVNAILAKRLSARYSPTDRTRDQNDSDNVDVLSIRLAMSVYAKLAARYGAKYVEGIRHELCGHYGLEIPARPRRTRRRPAAAAA